MIHKARTFVSNLTDIFRYIDQINDIAKKEGVYTEHHISVDEQYLILNTTYDSKKEYICREHCPDGL